VSVPYGSLGGGFKAPTPPDPLGPPRHSGPLWLAVGVLLLAALYLWWVR
jgi:hypothetical protein